jgi:uncharacterized membrane protein YcjF (UPF0283 family)
MSQTDTSKAENLQMSLEGAERRSSVLSQGAAAIRARSGGRLSLDKSLLVFGGILVPLGIGAIVLGWYGVAHTAYGFEQNSYIVSGGLLGLGLVLVGGVACLGSWISRQIRISSLQHRQTMRVMERLAEDNKGAVAATQAVARILAAYVGDPGSPGGYSSTDNRLSGALHRAPVARRNGTGSQSGANAGNLTITSSFVATKRGTLVHRRDCPIVATKGDLKQVEASEEGYEPCRICAPLIG